MRMMNRKGLFGPLIVLILLFMLIWVWAIILPTAVTPSIESTIAHENASGYVYADGVEFFLRMIPWGVPLILVMGFLWIMVKG